MSIGLLARSVLTNLRRSMHWVGDTYRFGPLIAPILALWMLTACEHPLGPAEPLAPEDTTDSVVEVRQLLMTVSKWHYSETNPAFLLIYFEDPDVDSSSSLISIAYLDPYKRWINVLWLDAFPLCILYVSGEIAFGKPAGYALLLYDPNHHLLFKRIRIRYIA